MAIKSEGSPLSFSEIQAELGGSNPIALSEYYKNNSIVNNDIFDPNTIPNTGNAISVNDFYRCARRQFARWSGGSPSNRTVSGNFRTHVFNNSGGFNRTQQPIGTDRDELHYIVIGGGGGGGTITGGGGGAGDFMSGHIHTGNRTNYYMSIGGGGGPANFSTPNVRHPTGTTNRGTQSAIQANSSGNSTRYVTGIGGGGGMNYSHHTASNSSTFFANGGSGGGGSGIVDSQRGFEIGSGAGHDGGNGAEREETLCGGGGGGAGRTGVAGGGEGPFADPGINASRGGTGINITGFPGANGFRAGGGTGGGLRSYATRTPFSGGGGSGGPGPGIASTPGGNGGSNQGAGGGGGGYNGNGVGGLGGSGGKGIIAVKYNFQ